MTDETALCGALAKALANYGIADVPAGFVASELFGEGPISHADYVRVGQALARLAREGKVCQIKARGDGPSRWTLPDAPCRGCGERFPYHPEADFCPACSSVNAGEAADDA